MSENASVTITRQSGYQFLVDFGHGLPTLLADEPAPLGEGTGPAPDHMLLAAVANCLSASLLFALQKFKQDPGTLVATATPVMGRNADKRLRIEAINVKLELGQPAGCPGAPGPGAGSVRGVLHRVDERARGHRDQRAGAGWGGGCDQGVKFRCSLPRAGERKDQSRYLGAPTISMIASAGELP